MQQEAAAGQSGGVPLLPVAAMRELDRRASTVYGLPVRQLMEVAGHALARRALALRQGAGPVVVLCGGGHNGGDGLAAARHMAAAGAAVEVVLYADPGRLDEAPAENLRLLQAAGVVLRQRPAASELELCLARAALVVDALLGTGFRGPLRDPLAQVIASVNACGRPVLAADVPSGLSGDLGPEPSGPAVRATATLCFGTIKPGLFVPPGRQWAGDLECEPLGVPRKAWEGLEVLQGLDDALVRALLPPRRPTAHKGTYGTVAAVAGATGLAGAAALCAEACLRAGCGLVQLLCPASLTSVLATKLTEAILAPLPADGSGAVAAEAVQSPALAEALQRVEAVVVGPGLGRGPGAQAVLRHILAAYPGPVVVDADGLNAVDLSTLAAARGQVVITPHPGEAGRLLGCSAAEVQADRLAAVRRLAQGARAVAVLKGAGTLVADPVGGPVALCPTGNDGMATGGTGDVLAGVVAGLLAQGATPAAAARAGVYVHGRAGDLAAATLGRRGLLAGDLLRHLGAAFASIDPGEQQLA